jgi:hypothetical protein
MNELIPCKSPLPSKPDVAPVVSQERLHRLLHYNADSGIFTWKHSRGPRARAGDEAGAVDSYGYVVIKVDFRLYKAHRLAWLYVHGRWPESQLDHINGNPSDNRLLNLREASDAENAQNKKLPKSNTSGLMGATWHKRNKKWVATISSVHLGYFNTAQEAHDAYCKAKANLHKFQPTVRNK